MLGSHVKIIYASTSGNVEAVCQKAADIISEHGYSTELIRSETIDIAPIITHNLFIFAASTWEHGRLNPFFEPLVREMKEVDLTGKYAGLIGLGDRRYEPVYFCEGINIIERKFTGSGGKKIGDTLKIDGDPFPHMDSDVTNWAHLFVSHVHEING